MNKEMKDRRRGGRRRFIHTVKDKEPASLGSISQTLQSKRVCRLRIGQIQANRWYKPCHGALAAGLAGKIDNDHSTRGGRRCEAAMLAYLPGLYASLAIGLFRNPVVLHSAWAVKARSTWRTRAGQEANCFCRFVKFPSIESLKVKKSIEATDAILPIRGRRCVVIVRILVAGIASAFAAKRGNMGS